MNEKDFLQAVIDLAHLKGWLVAHFRPARTEKGWRTAIQGDKGFPDLVMIRANGDAHLIIAELKSEKGNVTDEQQEWLDMFAELQEDIELQGKLTEVVRVFVWRPSDWEAIVGILS